MLIDWFTVIAQVINFLILVWLLKRFLYRPILDAIDAREKSISVKIADAEAKQVVAQEQQDEYQSKNEIFDKEQAERMTMVMQESDKERTKMLDSARSESEELRKKLEQAFVNEQHSLIEDLERLARDEVFAIARMTLSDLAGITLEERITEIFISRLRELDQAKKPDFISALNSSSGPLLVRSAFTLPAEQCSAIETELAHLLGNQKEVEFVISPDQICGIEIEANGQRIEWSIAGYLESLSKSIDDLLKSRVGAEGKKRANNILDIDKNEA